MENDWAPDRDSLIETIRLIARGPDGRPLALTDDEMRADPALLLGILDAAVDEIAERFSIGVGRGNSRRHHVVLGYKAYLTRSGYSAGSLGHFFQRRLARLAGDMETSFKLPP